MHSKVAVMVVPGDRILGRVASVGMAAAAGTGLVIDLVEGDFLPSVPTLAGLEQAGIRRSHLEPSRSGVALISRGDLDLEHAGELVTELTRHWPVAVVRAGAEDAGQFGVPFEVRSFLPGMPGVERSARIVWQRLSHGQRPPGPSLPPLARARAQQMLRGTVSRRWRWVKAWEPIWGLV